MEGGIKQTSYYEILGVAVDSSAEQIRRAYHKLAMRWHPDRWTKDPVKSGEAKRRFQQIQEAYSGKDLLRLFFEVFVCLLLLSELTVLFGNILWCFSFVGWEETKSLWCRTLWFWRRWGMVGWIVTLRVCNLICSLQKADLFLFLLWRDTLILFKRWSHSWLRIKER